MNGKSNCYDNAVCESFFHMLKTELVYRGSIKRVIKQGVQFFGISRRITIASGDTLVLLA